MATSCTTTNRIDVFNVSKDVSETQAASKHKRKTRLKKYCIWVQLSMLTHYVNCTLNTSEIRILYYFYQEFILETSSQKDGKDQYFWKVSYFHTRFKILLENIFPLKKNIERFSKLFVQSFCQQDIFKRARLNKSERVGVRIE